MLDKNTNTVLMLLSKQAGDGYIVLEKQPLLDALPKKIGLNMQSFCSIVSFLKEQGYVDVKYQDKDTICLCTTTKARNYFDGRKETSGTKLANKQFVSLLLCVGACAFVGAFLAMVLFQLMF